MKCVTRNIKLKLVAAGMRLAAQIDSDLISMVTQRATNVITMADSTTGSQGRDLWNCAAGIDATMTAIGVPQGINRRSFWNPSTTKTLLASLVTVPMLRAQP